LGAQEARQGELTVAVKVDGWSTKVSEGHAMMTARVTEMGARPVTSFTDCVFRLSADGNVRISNSSHVGDFSSRVTERLEQWAATAPDRVFLARRTGAGWREVTYADALDAARRIGQALLDRGLGHSRSVLILSGNGIEHALLSLACLHVGVPFVPLATAYSLLSSDHVRLRDIVALVQPALVFADDGTRYAAAIRDCIAADTEVVIVHGESSRAATPFRELLATAPRRDVQVAAAAIRPDTVAKLLFTSGSTGFPKGVISTQRTICSTLQTLLACYPVLADEPPVLVDWMPWNHIIGGTVNLGLALFNGGTFYIDDGKPLPGLIETTIGNLREVAPVIYSTVPKAFAELVPWLRKDAALRKRFFSRVQLFQYSGASISQNVCDAFDELALQAVGKRIPWVGLFGSTEAGPMLADQHARGSSAGRVGLPVPGVTLKLARVDGKLEARIKSPCVTPGYWKREDLTSTAFDEEGFFRTGDALSWVDKHDPKQGLRYDGRIAEDFKLTTGIWVRVGLLRDRLLKCLAPEVRDVVIVGENRNYIAVLAVPSTPEIAESQAARARVLGKLTTLAKQATGSSQRVLRLAFLTRSLSVDAGELTEKGLISQRGILRRHADLIEELYADKPADNILCVAVESPASVVTDV
jgi:feruloyl-CoA synthase